MSNLITTLKGFDLPPWERKLVEAEITERDATYPIPVAMAPSFHTTDLFPCGSLNLQEHNVDCQGNVTKCYHLSGTASASAPTTSLAISVGFRSPRRTNIS